jgi:hypothetical protein
VNTHVKYVRSSSDAGIDSRISAIPSAATIAVYLLNTHFQIGVIHSNAYDNMHLSGDGEVFLLFVVVVVAIFRCCLISNDGPPPLNMCEFA